MPDYFQTLRDEERNAIPPPDWRWRYVSVWLVIICRYAIIAFFMYLVMLGCRK